MLHSQAWHNARKKYPGMLPDARHHIFCQVNVVWSRAYS
jgi:hypothetical protein